MTFRVSILATYRADGLESVSRKLTDWLDTALGPLKDDCPVQTMVHEDIGMLIVDFISAMEKFDGLDHTTLYHNLNVHLTHFVDMTQEDLDVLDLALELTEDKSLSAKTRKRMKTTTFCAPKERAFPVPDCAHIVAARRFLSRYKGKTQKKTIAACIERRARKLGCKPKSK